MPVKVGLRFIEKWSTDLEAEVQKYEAQNDEKGKIVFYGPSNFTRWDGRYAGLKLENEIVGASGVKCCINRGFGSSCAEQQLYYYPRMVRAIEPKVLVYTGYGNSASFGYTDEEAWELAQRVIAYAKADFPDIRIYLVAPFIRFTDKPEASVARRAFIEVLKAFCEETEDCFCLDPNSYSPLCDPATQESLLDNDKKHFNADGYRLYGEFFREALKDELAKF